MRRLILCASVAIAMLLLLAAPAVSATYTRYPTDDVCVRSDSGSINTAGNPTGALLYVGGHIVDTVDYWTTYMKFDLSQFSAGTINSATLKMYCESHSGASVNISVFEILSETGTWSENFMSEQTAISNFTISGSAAATTTVNATNSVFNWSVTSAASSHQGGDFTLCIREQNQPSVGRWAKLYSNDHTTTGYRPYLSVDYTADEPDDPRGYIDFDPSLTIENLITPEPYNPFDAYVTIDQMTGGLTSCSFALSVTPGISSPPSFENLLPGDLAIGNWETGITLASSECLGLGGDPVNVGVLHLYYLGGEGDVMLLDHPEYPRWVVNCAEPGEVSIYCVLSHGGVAKTPILGDCGASPAQDVTWGSIKAMYR